MPMWAAQPTGSLHFPEPVKSAFKNDAETGVPTRQDCEKIAWSRYYFAEAASTAFQALYDNKDGLLDAWAAMWSTVVTAFKGESHILGVELINEPWAGDVVHDPLLLVPGHADKVNLQRVYDRLAKAVWDADADRLVFFAPVTWDNLGNGFTHAPGGVPERSVLVYHYYEWPDGPQLKNSSGGQFLIHVNEAARLGTGAMLTEFAEAGSLVSPGEFDGAAGSAEALGQSWASWEYKTFCKPAHAASQEGRYGACKTGFGGSMWTKSGNVNQQNYHSLARPYATAVAGAVVAARFDVSAETYTLEYIPDRTATAPTEIRVAFKLRYPNEFAVTVTPPGAATWTQTDATTISLAFDTSQPDGTVVAITISPTAEQSLVA